MDFILIDDIAAALKYNTMQSMEICLSSLKDLSERHGILVIMGIDPDTNKALYALTKTYINNEIKIDERWLHG